MSEKGSNDKHDSMLIKFIDYLKKEKFNNYSVEFPVSINKKNLGFADVAVFYHDKMFLFEIKSGQDRISNDIQQMKKYIFSLEKGSWRDIRGFMVYSNSLKENLIKYKSMFRNIGILFLDENNISVNDLNNKELKEIISLSVGRFPKLRTIIKAMFYQRPD